ncbi:MAG TPA: hypothetical protein VLF18_10180 [Tahibacter sp.]|uniref:hypothetical protein n=1 Tax=Tahibacter sp. TaxID=2056211 RepID=UPI002D02A190|nr:hypothetical protein [Tahibacter sp.]HSX60555.1 hypothetical protein [Tahibacter sp.]
MDGRICRAAVLCAALLPATAGALGVELVSRGAFAAPMDSNGPTERIDDVTPDGRFTLFSSSASNLVPSDTNRVADLFLHDAASGTLERVSVGTGGVQAAGFVGAIGGVSDDGRYVVFDSASAGLTAADTFGYRQVYLRDRVAGTTTLLSRLPGGVAGQGESANPKISADGRYVAFDTVVPFDAKDNNTARDIYRVDLQTGIFTLISVSESGRIGNADSLEPRMSADGSSIAFHTWATNLVPGDINNYRDIVLRKPASGTTQRVSVKADGSPMQSYPELSYTGSLSSDGRYVLFNAYEALSASDTNDTTDGYRYDSQDGSILRVTLATGGAEMTESATATAMSRDASRIVMDTLTADVLPGQPRGYSRVFLRTIATGDITHVTFRSGGEVPGDHAYAAALADDGETVVALTSSSGFVADDTNDMSDLIRQSGRSNPAQRLSSPLAGFSSTAANNDSAAYFQGSSGSADARFIAFSSRATNLVPGDLNGVEDVFVRDRLLGTMERVSIYANGAQGFCGSFSPSISDDGRYVAFFSCTPFDEPVPAFRSDIYVHDRVARTTALVSRRPDGQPANNTSALPQLSADGRYVTFSSCATDLVADDVNGMCDVFVRDLSTGVTVLATRSIGTGGADAHTQQSWISRNGRLVFFNSDATNLVADDTNGISDVFAFDRVLQTVERINVSSQEQQSDNYSAFEDVSEDGNQVLFWSSASNMVTNGPYFGAYLRNRTTGETELISRMSGGEPLVATGPAVISADGQRAAFVTGATYVGMPEGFKLMLLNRGTGRVSLIYKLDDRYQFSGDVSFLDGGRKLLLASRDNALVDGDSNNHFSDVFLLDKIEDHLFANGFQSQ